MQRLKHSCRHWRLASPFNRPFAILSGLKERAISQLKDGAINL